MGEKSKHLFNPCRAPMAQRLPAKIWELLRRNELFRSDVNTLQALDKRARHETVKYREIACQYNQAVAQRDAALAAEWQPRYAAVKDRPLRRKSFGFIEGRRKKHPLAALALQWMVPEPLFVASRVREGQVEEGAGQSPDLNDPSWTWWKSNAPKGAIGHSIMRGPEIATAFEDWQNWCPGKFLFDCHMPWNRLPKSFKSEFVRVWRECYDSQDAYEFKYIFPPRKQNELSTADAARYFDFLDTVSLRRLFAVSPVILTTKDVGAVFKRLLNRVKRGLPESREHIFGSQSAWNHYIAIKERELPLQKHILGEGSKAMGTVEIRNKVRNQRRNVKTGVKAVEKLITLVYPTFEFKRAVLVHSAPPRDKLKRRKPQNVSIASKPLS